MARPSIPHPLFRSANRDGLRRAQMIMTPVSVAPGHTIIKEGSFGSEFLLLVDGAVEVTRSGRAVTQLDGGDFCGEVALLHGGRRNATVVAATELDLYAMSRAEFSTLCAVFPDVAETITRTALARSA